MIRGFARRRPVVCFPPCYSHQRRYDASSTSLAPGGASSGSNSAAVSMDSVWSLWNEGNLFSLSIPELTSFLASQNVTVNPDEKKTALVRKVEELMAASSPSLVRVDDSAISAFESISRKRVKINDTFEEADIYGDWGLDPTFEEKRSIDFLQKSLDSQSVDQVNPLASRAQQVLHSATSSEVVFVPLKTNNLPGSLAKAQAYTLKQADPEVGNRDRFRKACAWAMTSLRQLGQEGDFNVTFGRAFIKSQMHFSTYKTNILPLWSVQKAMGRAYTHRFLSLAHEDNTDGVGAFLKDNGFKTEHDLTISYLVQLRRQKDHIVLELNDQLKTVKALDTWDRHLVSTYIRPAMPDIRFMVRGRVPLKHRVAGPYIEAQVLNFKDDTVESVLAPELGDIKYVAARDIASWYKVDSASGLTIKMIQTKRTPVLTTVPNTQGERLEYELTAALPSSATNVDTDVISNAMWEWANLFAKALEPGHLSLKSELAITPDEQGMLRDETQAAQQLQ
eukprot:PhF_6_TR30190/c0_g1_i1/m.44346